MKRQLINTFALAVLAGIMIGFGGIVFLMCANRLAGAFLFSFGLLTIICQGLAARAFSLTRHTCDVASVVAPKLADSSMSVFVLAVGCGAMMFLAVDSYRRSQSWLFVILPIVIFILSGFEHSIANMFYLSLADAWDWDALRITLLAIAGNAVGSWLVNSRNFTLGTKE